MGRYPEPASTVRNYDQHGACLDGCGRVKDVSVRSDGAGGVTVICQRCDERTLVADLSTAIAARYLTTPQPPTAA